MPVNIRETSLHSDDDDDDDDVSQRKTGSACRLHQ